MGVETRGGRRKKAACSSRKSTEYFKAQRSPSLCDCSEPASLPLEAEMILPPTVPRGCETWRWWLMCPALSRPQAMGASRWFSLSVRAGKREDRPWAWTGPGVKRASCGLSFLTSVAQARAGRVLFLGRHSGALLESSLF